MPTLSSMQIPPPQSWKEFEELTLDSCKLRWENPDLQMHGRQGQKQDGVDIYGANHLFNQIGVQCKNYKESPSIALVQKEILNAEKFQPPIDMLYIAVSAETDANIQQQVRLLSQQRTKEGKFPVMILFWNDIIQDLVKNKDNFKKHYPEITISDYSSKYKANTKLFSIFDLAYNGLNLDFYCELIFGEIGAMVGEDPLQIKSVILTMKHSASNVMSEENYKTFSSIIEKYKNYLFPEDEEHGEFKWETARGMSSELIAMTAGIQYELSQKELAVYNIAKTLVNWSKWEVGSMDEPYGDEAWNILKKLVEQLGIDRLNERMIDLETKYNSLNGAYRSCFQQKVFNAVRRELFNLNDGIE